MFVKTIQLEKKENPEEKALKIIKKNINENTTYILIGYSIDLEINPNKINIDIPTFISKNNFNKNKYIEIVFMEANMKSIAIDGPAGAGKSTVAALLSKELNIHHLDTGSMYRSLAYFAIKENIDLNNEGDLTKLLNSMNFTLKENKLLINGENLPKEIREQKYAQLASDIGGLEKVRLTMQDKQRKLAKNNRLIMDGRDIGSCVLLDGIKFYLDAKPEIRAKRRFDQGDSKKFTLEEVLENINKRDYADMNREIAPLIIAEGAIVIDSSNLTIEETVKIMKEEAKLRL